MDFGWWFILIAGIFIAVWVLVGRTYVKQKIAERSLPRKAQARPGTVVHIHGVDYCIAELVYEAKNHATYIQLQDVESWERMHRI